MAKAGSFFVAADPVLIAVTDHLHRFFPVSARRAASS
jgi:hypothetical protein